MEKEIFGPILTVFVFPDDKTEATLHLAEKSAYGLTGSIFANDRCASATRRGDEPFTNMTCVLVLSRYFIEKATSILEYGCGNLYINDKPTGAVVGQQPFGGARASGTNDKAGGKHNLLRFVNVRSIKENLVPDTTPFYPYMFANKQ